MKSISVIVCVDERMGMMFNKRRQSRDRVLIQDIINSCDEKIYIGEYSRLLFEPHEGRYAVCKNPLDDCPDGGICFIENLPLAPHVGNISRLTVYNWNRRYPFDMRLDIDIEKEGFRKVSETEFVGSSHDKITKGVYVK